MSIVETNIPYSSIILHQNIMSLKQYFPFISIQTVRYSVLSKPLYVIQLGVGAKKVFYSASFHANEWITSVLLMKFVEHFCNAYSSDSQLFGYSVREIYNSASIYIMPMVNPDGVDLVTGYLPPDSLAYKKAKDIASNYPSIAFPSGWKANIKGVDLNLQFPAGWEQAKQIKFSQGFTSPAPRDFVGMRSTSCPRIISYI